MPWNQGGGPWGSGGGGGGGGNQGGGGQNPWGRPSGGGGMQPPNVEELLRKSQEKIRRFMPGGMGSGKIVAIIVVVVAALWIASGFYVISPSQQGLVLRFGEYNRPALPGLNWHLPSPVESVIVINVEALNSTEVPGEGQTLQRGLPATDQREDVVVTGDENMIEVRFVVQWRVSDARQFAFNVRRAPEGTRVPGSGDLIRGVAMSAIREVIAQMPAQRVLAEGRTQLATDTAAIMQRLFNAYQAGVQVTQVQIRDINPPAQVVAAFRDVQSAQADRERLRNEAETYRNTVVPQARGEAQRMLLEAEAFRQRAVAEARGEADRFVSVLEAYRVAPDVTTQRLYIETIEQVLRGSNRVIVDQPQGSQGVLPFLPLPELRRAAPGTAPAAGSPPGTPNTPPAPNRGTGNITGGNRP